MLINHARFIVIYAYETLSSWYTCTDVYIGIFRIEDEYKTSKLFLFFCIHTQITDFGHIFTTISGFLLLIAVYEQKIVRFLY